jgi:hypothetical protein
MGNNEINIKEIFSNGFNYEDIENLFLSCNSKEELQTLYESFKKDKSYNEELTPKEKVQLCFFVYEVIPLLKSIK